LRKGEDIGALGAGQAAALVADEKLHRSRCFLHHDRMSLTIIVWNGVHSDFVGFVAAGKDRRRRSKHERPSADGNAAVRGVSWARAHGSFPCVAPLNRE
jgi:hypothetical protein